MVCCGMVKKSMIGYCRALVSERVIRSVYGMVWKGIVEPLMLERIVWCQAGALFVRRKKLLIVKHLPDVGDPPRNNCDIYTFPFQYFNGAFDDNIDNR